MIHRWFKKHLLNKKTINNHSSMSLFNNNLRYSNVWRLNGPSIARGTAIGLFVAFIPLPLQMLIAALLALLFRANLPIAVFMTWITNPFTFVPFNYFIYWIGKKIMGESLAVTSFAWQIESFSAFGSSFYMQVSQLGKAYLVGLPIVAIGVSALGYLIVKIAWYSSALLSKHLRRKNRT